MITLYATWYVSLNRALKMRVICYLHYCKVLSVNTFDNGYSVKGLMLVHNNEDRKINKIDLAVFEFVHKICFKNNKNLKHN